MKKIISIALMIAMIAMSVCIFASCETVFAAAAIEKADKALAEGPYTVTMSMDFDSDHEQLSKVFDAMTVEFPITVDGDNLHMNMAVDIMEGVSVGMNMTVVDKVLYCDTSLYGQSMKMKATLSEEEYKKFVEENSSEMPVSPDNFATLEMETVDGKQIITCSGITDDGITELNKVLTDSLTEMGADAAVGDISFVLTISDGKYESMALTASYSVTVAGETFAVSMTMNAKYTYGEVLAIVAPADADKYTEYKFDEILG